MLTLPFIIELFNKTDRWSYLLCEYQPSI